MSAGTPYYITTAISYPNGRPHIGHAYELIATDVMARFMRLDGRDVFFLTGTDEHGLKMEQTARREGVTPREFANRMTPQFEEMARALNASNDDFIRTTEDRHRASVQELWRRMDANGDIYLDSYAGWYSVRDEAYYAEDELIEGEGGEKLSPQGTPVDWVEEPSYFFRLSAYQDKLLALYESQPDFVMPESRRNEVMSFVKSGLRDLSMSRTTFSWGVPVPGDDAHVMYVWVDALTNYVTATGFPDESAERYTKYWPADAHIIGKDIVRFHAIYWPAFLMSAGLPLPKRIFAHGFLNVKGEKMSKSVGNVVDPFELADAFGVDQIRYFFMREVPFGNDGSYSPESMIQRINSDLANDVGNLAQRSLSMINKNCGAQVPQPGELSAEDDALLTQVHGLRDAMRLDIDVQAIHTALAKLFAVVADANRYVDAQAPWTLRKTDPDRMRTVLYVLAETVRHIAILLQPVTPESANRMLDQLAIPAEKRDFEALGPDSALTPGTELPIPQGRVPAPCGDGGAGGVTVLVDSHCHLDFPELHAELDDVVARAGDAGIGTMVTICTRMDKFEGVCGIADQFPHIWCTVGVHPHEAQHAKRLTAKELIRHAQEPKCIGIGEAGLDYYYNRSPAEDQRTVFRTHIEAARETGLPLVVHTRDADDDMAEILETEMEKGAFTGVLHCFSSSQRLARRALDIGFYISFSGILTFKNAHEVQATADFVPMDRVLVETDAPFLAPVPMRGKRNEPAYNGAYRGEIGRDQRPWDR